MDEHTTNIVAIAASLTEAEREALRLFKDRKWVFSDNTPGFHSLFTRRMVVRDFDGLLPAWYFELTDLGSAVLAALDSVATAQPETNRKTIITAFTFYDENYERKIREGLCKVYDMVGDIVVAFKGLDDYVHLETIDKITGKPRVDGFMRSQLLTAVWLPTAPAQVTEAAQAEAGDTKAQPEQRKYVSYWKLLKTYVKEFEIANKCHFDNNAWDRIKKLEQDIITSAWIERSEAVALETEALATVRADLEAERARRQAQMVAACEAEKLRQIWLEKSKIETVAYEALQSLENSWDGRTKEYKHHKAVSFESNQALWAFQTAIKNIGETIWKDYLKEQREALEAAQALGGSEAG